MWLWMLLLIAMAAFCIFGVIYIAFRLERFSFFQGLAAGHRTRFRLISIGALVLLLVLISLWLNAFNGIIVYLHLLVFWLVADFLAFLIRKIKAGKKGKGSVGKPGHYWAGAVTIVFTIVYLSVGAYLDYHVWEKEYTIETDKDVKDLRIAMIADSHVGATFGSEGFADHLKEIQAAEPDLLLICGDYVDDGTSYQDMISCCKALGDFQSTYGVYFVFGNHDKGYYNTREYDGDDLIAELEKNGVTVLQDQTILVADDYYLVGRQDASEEMRGNSRAEAGQLVSDLDTSKYMIVMNHQPNDYDAETEAGVDLVLSGHTHGGQLFPLNLIENLVHVDDRVYGKETRGNTNFIVTSGISDWTIKFKTCCRSEYVIVNIKGK